MNPENLPEMPARIARLPVRRGYPVPYFVAMINNEPDFRIVDPAKWFSCVDDHRCWICGDKLGSNLAFVLGPMGVINRVTSEPASHHQCAIYAVKACPFLVYPHARRREVTTAAVAINDNVLVHNPGVAAVYITRSFKPVKNSSKQKGGPCVLDLGAPYEVTWWAEGLNASRSEVLRGLEEGLKNINIIIDEQSSEHLRKRLRGDLADKWQLVQMWIPTNEKPRSKQSVEISGD